MENTAIENFTRLVEELKKNERVEVIKHSGNILKIDEKTKAMFLKRMLNKLGYQLSNDLLEYINISNATQLYWTYNLGNKRAGGGEFKLNSLFEVFLFERPKLWNDTMSKDEIELLQKFAIFDDHPLIGNGQLSGFIINGAMPPEIYFYDRGETFKMNITYQEYIDEMLELFAINNWQYLFCNIERSEFQQYIYENLEKKLDDLKELFPGKNLEKYYAIINK